MSKTKYQELFGLVINSPDTLTIELDPNDLAGIKSGLAKLKTKYNNDTKLLIDSNPDYAGQFTLIEGKFQYKEMDDQKPLGTGNKVYEISLQKEDPLNFTLLAGD